jgi:hypothetical protein
VKANELAVSPRRISEGGGKSIQSYEGRMGVFDWGIIVIALIALTIVIMCIFSTWMAFEKSVGPTF